MPWWCHRHVHATKDIATLCVPRKPVPIEQAAPADGEVAQEPVGKRYWGQLLQVQDSVLRNLPIGNFDQPGRGFCHNGPISKEDTKADADMLESLTKVDPAAKSMVFPYILPDHMDTQILSRMHRPRKLEIKGVRLKDSSSQILSLKHSKSKGPKDSNDW